MLQEPVRSVQLVHVSARVGHAQVRQQRRLVHLEEPVTDEHRRLRTHVDQPRSHHLNRRVVLQAHPVDRHLHGVLDPAERRCRGQCEADHATRTHPSVH